MKPVLSKEILERLESIQKERAATDEKLADVMADVLRAVGQGDAANLAHETVIATLHPEKVDTGKTPPVPPIDPATTHKLGP